MRNEFSIVVGKSFRDCQVYNCTTRQKWCVLLGTCTAAHLPLERAWYFQTKKWIHYLHCEVKCIRNQLEILISILWKDRKCNCARSSVGTQTYCFCQRTHFLALFHYLAKGQGLKLHKGVLAEKNVIKGSGSTLIFFFLHTIIF